MKKFLFIFLIVFSLLFCFKTYSQNNNITVAWNPITTTPIAGYNIYYDTTKNMPTKKTIKIKAVFK